MSETQLLAQKSLGSGLTLRRSTPADADRLAAFNGRIHGDDPQDAEAVAAWTRDLLSGRHPTFHSDDFLLVEEEDSGEIVSSLNLISQTWTYEGIRFGVGRPELVGTDPRCRNRGLVRAQFEVIHEWSRERGELVQVITGIPFYYRQFGYEMGLELGGGRSGFEPQITKLLSEPDEAYRIRPAVEADLPFLVTLYERGSQRSLVSAVWEAAMFRHELLEKSPQNVNRQVFCVIETHEGQPVGYLSHPGFAWKTTMPLEQFELLDGVSYLAVSPTVIRYLWKVGQEYAQARGQKMDSFSFWLGSQHPAYIGAAAWLCTERKPYAYYVRAADLPGFLQRIGPALENRLRTSPFTGYSGELKVSFYRQGVCLAFEQGRLARVEAWKPGVGEETGVSQFPNLTFLQLVFGYRTVEEISYAYADCIVSEPYKSLLNTLFPKKPSRVIGIT